MRHDAAQMAARRDRAVRRLRRADVFRAALADVFPGARAHRRRPPPGLPQARGGGARHRRRREGDRLACAAARRQAGGPLFPRQRRLAALSRRPLPRADRRRHRARRAELSRLWRLDRQPDRGRADRRRRAAYEFAAARYPAERIVLWGESLGTGVAIALAADRKAVAHRAGGAVHLGRRCRRQRPIRSCRCGC